MCVVIVCKCCCCCLVCSDFVVWLADWCVGSYVLRAVCLRWMSCCVGVVACGVACCC